MSKGKPRWYPEKKQNNYPKVCPYYETYSWIPGVVNCEGGDSRAAYICKGNPHKCMKTYLHKMASTKKGIQDDK